MILNRLSTSLCEEGVQAFVVKSSFASNEGVNTAKESSNQGHASALVRRRRHNERHGTDRRQRSR
jgi:hypothetical protein